MLVQLGVGRLESTVIKGSMPGTTNALITLAAFPDAVGKLRASGIRTNNHTSSTGGLFRAFRAPRDLAWRVTQRCGHPV
ncbi:hypothetical protein AS189_12775 [Arthrobacter alpinus]|uniref:Uncharacterized protein n=1 Tax=Arthrobacter alpinus TaxID=656366 RepID=A0A0S2M0F7_9MICC|nr:hypothetical protein [Arthrobacter alpinus]ALO67213.1 hypothetical protein AS189_12775 [Arthrobacter alpinus]